MLNYHLFKLKSHKERKSHALSFSCIIAIKHLARRSHGRKFTIKLLFANLVRKVDGGGFCKSEDGGGWRMVVEDSSEEFHLIQSDVKQQSSTN